MNKNTGIGILYAVLGVVLFSSKAVLVKLAYAYEIDSLSLLLLRMIFALPFYLVIAFWKPPLQVKEIKKKDYLWVFVFGFFGYYLASFFDFIGLQYLKAGLERIILFCYPTIVVLFSWIFFRKRVNSTTVWAILITYFGVGVIFWTEIAITGEQVLWGGFLILLSAITYASYLVGSGWLIPKFGVLAFTSYAMLVATFCIIIHYIVSGNSNVLSFAPEVYWLSAGMAIFATVLPSFLVSAAISRLGASTFSIFGSLGPMATILLAFIFLDEKISPLQIAGMLVVLIGVSMVSKKSPKS